MDKGIHFCVFCEEPILPGDRLAATMVSDQPVHHECFFRAIVGGANHIRGNCSCCGGALPPDPPEMTRREAAREAVRVFKEKNPWLPDYE